MTATWYPFVKASTSSLMKTGSEKETSFLNLAAENPDEAAGRLQVFYLCLAEDMRDGGIPFSSNRRENDELDGVDERERDKHDHETMEIETRVCDVMEIEERTTRRLLPYFYDRFVPFSCCPSFYSIFARLLMQSTTDDLSHQIGLQRLIIGFKS